MFAAFDPWILSFSAITVLATIWMGYWAAQKARTASDFFVAGRGVSVGWNASAISGEYLSAASFMGIAGMVMSSGYDALWYPVCYACGYLFLLLFIAGPLRRFGAYTIPDFAEGRYDSPIFRKIAVIFVLFIGFFYTMPQMKGAGTTLSYIFQDITWFGQKGLPYWVGVVLVGVVITFNVAVGGMKGITLVQAFQYWLKMFAISVPIFVLMAVYGGYGRQLQEQNPLPPPPPSAPLPARVDAVNDPGRLRSAELHVSDAVFEYATLTGRKIQQPGGEFLHKADLALHGWLSRWKFIPSLEMPSGVVLRFDVPETPAVDLSGNYLKSAPSLGLSPVPSAGTMLGSGKIIYGENPTTLVHETASQRAAKLWHALREVDVELNPVGDQDLRVVWHRSGIPSDAKRVDPTVQLLRPLPMGQIRGQNTTPTEDLRASVAKATKTPTSTLRQSSPAKAPPDATPFQGTPTPVENLGPAVQVGVGYTSTLAPRVSEPNRYPIESGIQSTDQQWNTAGNHRTAESGFFSWIKQAFRSAGMRWDSYVPPTTGISLDRLAVGIYPEFLFPPQSGFRAYFPPGLEAASVMIKPATNSPGATTSGPQGIRDLLAANGYSLVHLRGNAVKIFPTSEATRYAAANPIELENARALPESELHKQIVPRRDSSSLRQPLPAKAPPDATWLNPFGPLTTKAAKAAKLEGDQVKPYALLYTYSLIIALVCGTAGLPHILVRFYTNPDGVAAKRTTMWVMILIGVFYVFPPVFGVMGRNLMPALYEGTGAKGTDKVVLELPKVLDTSAPGAAAGMTGTTPRSTAAERGSLPWGSILSGITCAGAFAAFMSTFSGLLVSMTGALAHDVYGRMLRPQSSAADRMRMFKWCAALIGGVATVLGCFVEPLEINFMVGQAFAIAAASYFPLLFMSVWWRGMTIRGAATGMLVGGVCALLAVALTNASNLALDKGPMGQLFSAFAPLNAFWAAHPLLRILCEQPAIWTVPLAILLMIVVSRLTAATAPSDIRLKMLVLHAPEKLGLKQDYIREHEGAGH